MIRTCNGQDPNLRDEQNLVGNCGRTFNDVNHWTTCPHDEFPVNPAAMALIDREHGGLAVEAVQDNVAGLGVEQPIDPSHVQAGRWARTDEDQARIVTASNRYHRAIHTLGKVLTGLCRRRPALVDAGGLRLSVDLSKAEQAGLARLLIGKGVFTEAEYFEAMADAAELEQLTTTEQLARITLRRTS